MATVVRDGRILGYLYKELGSRPIGERGGPAFLDSFRGQDKWSSAVYAAAASGRDLKYTVSGVCRSSEV
jgi:hypothetical protein